MKNVQMRFIRSTLEVFTPEGNVNYLVVKQLQYREKLPDIPMMPERWSDWYTVEEIEESDVYEERSEEATANSLGM